VTWCVLFWCLQRFETVRSEIAVEIIVEMTVIRLGRGWDGDVTWAGSWRLKMELWRRVKCCTSVVAAVLFWDSKSCTSCSMYF
jgi:hypothetical protein